MTFNNAAIHGFKKGFLTAFGAALGDGFLLLMGLFGALSIVEQYQYGNLCLDIAGGILLITIGSLTLKRHYSATQTTTTKRDSALATVTKTFLLTTVNPVSVAFFVFAASKILPLKAGSMPTHILFVGSTVTISASTSILGTVAFIASFLGRKINPQRLNYLTTLTGILMFCTGIWFLGKSITFFLD
ncbi:MAG: LysE family transporter [Epsilonproteobacteria bacterium]|nr:LysE family transporter [Campylobacterota bacterium]